MKSDGAGAAAASLSAASSRPYSASGVGEAALVRVFQAGTAAGTTDAASRTEDANVSASNAARSWSWCDEKPP